MDQLEDDVETPDSLQGPRVLFLTSVSRVLAEEVSVDAMKLRKLAAVTMRCAIL